MWRVAAPPLGTEGASVIVAPARQPGGGATGMKSTASSLFAYTAERQREICLAGQRQECGGGGGGCHNSEI